MTQLVLLPQDLILVLKLLSPPARDWTYAEAGKHLEQSQSQIHRSVNRAAVAGLLYHPTLRASPNRAAMKEFVLHGVKYAFPASRGSITRGIPTSWAAPPMKLHLAPSPEPPPVWPYPEGPVRGLELTPLYKTVPKIALADSKLYELLALIDAVREGRAREREIAAKELARRIDSE